jgi:phage gp29-like protein
MGIWSRLFGSPPAAVVADARALADTPKSQTSAATPERYDRIEQPGSQLWRSYPEESITPERWRSIQRQADQGETSLLMELYDAVASDFHIAAQLRTRKLAVSGAPVTFEPGDDSDLALEVAEATTVAWHKIPNRSQLVTDLLDDFFRGFSCVRPIWDSVNGQWLVVGHEAVDSRYFRFVNGITPIICRTPGGIEGVPVPDGYFYSEFRDKAGAIVRAGVGRSVTRLWMYKGYSLIDTASFIERYGSPHAQVKTDRALQPGDPLIEQCREAARAILADQVGVLPAGCVIELVDVLTKGGTTKDVYLAWMNFLDQGASKAILGQVLTADAGPGGIGHGGAAEEQGDVRQDLKEADAEREGQVVDCGFSRPFALYHFGPNAPAARCRFDVAKPEDRVQATLAEKQRAETLNILRAAGLRILAKQQYVDFDLKEPKGITDETELPPPEPPPQATNVGDPAGGVPAPGKKPNGTKQPAKGDA